MTIRDDFPILSQTVNGEPLVYLDNAATTQKPRAVIDAISTYYEQDNANVHRAAHTLADRATTAFEGAREAVRGFINAASTQEVLFTKGTTESINLVATAVSSQLEAGDEVLITELEHHSNIVPWQMMCNRTGAVLRAARATPSGQIDLDDFATKLSPRTKIVAVGHVSNALGTINPVTTLISMAHDAGAQVLIDGAQAILHLPIDVRDLDCDYYAFSSHKMYGPTGMGVLYGKQARLEALDPYQGGGEMIEHVTIEHTTYNALPYRFEAGTPDIAGAIGLGAAVNYLQAIDREALLAAEDDLVKQTISGLQQLPGVRIVGEPEQRLAVVSFNAANAHPADLGTLLDQQGVAVRTGHHCTMPLMQALGEPGTVRASFSLYNSQDDVHRLLKAVSKALSLL